MIKIKLPIHQHISHYNSSCRLDNFPLNKLMSQLHLDLSMPYTHQSKSQRELLIDLLKQDLNFHERSSNYASHNFHSFPAKFPPQLPSKFILNLTDLGETVLDPMMGSGTTILEALIANRCGVGLDIDPLAQLISKVRLTPLDDSTAKRSGQNRS